MATQLAVLKKYSYRTSGRNVLESSVSGLVRGRDDAETNETIVGATINDTNTNFELQPIGSGIIDVVRDFNWNGNQLLTAYPKFPKMYMWERTQIESSLVSSYYYYITNILNALNNVDGVTASGSRVEGLVGNRAQRIVDKLSEYVGGAAKSTLELWGLAPDNAIARSANDFVDFFGKVFNDLRNAGSVDEVLLGEFLKSYLGIYFTRHTGFVYVMPYFQNKFQGGNISWSPTSNQPILQGMVDSMANTYVPLVSPGAYIEQPKYFNFQQAEGDSIDIEFPLLNTVSESYKKNYELLWILAFQNKYYRQGFASVRPPKIYTIQIPGVKYFPYAYISNLTIDFAGTRRLLEVATPRGSVEAPIPDAYIVRMRITSLLSDTANAMLTDHFHRQVNINIDPEIIDEEIIEFRRPQQVQQEKAVSETPIIGPLKQEYNDLLRNAQSTTQIPQATQNPILSPTAPPINTNNNPPATQQDIIDFIQQ